MYDERKSKEMQPEQPTYPKSICPRCGGQKQVTLLNGETVRCYECRGTGRRSGGYQTK